MTSQVSTKVRLVRCPKCRQVLAELPDVPLYKCGGCGTILQAKDRKMGTNHSELASQVRDGDANTQHVDAVGEKETRFSNGDLCNPAGDFSPNKNYIKYEDEDGDSSMELNEDTSVSNSLSTSPVVNCCESEDSPVEVEIPLGRNSRERAEARKCFDGFSSSSEDKESITEDNEKQEECMEQYVRRDENEGDESRRALQEGDNFLVEVQNSPDLKDKENESLPEQGEGMKEFHFLEKDENARNFLPHEGGGFHGEIDSSSVEIVSHGNGDASQTLDLSVELFDDTEDLSPSTEMESKACVDYSTPPQIPSKCSPISVDPVSPDNKHLVRNRVSISSQDTMGTSPPADHSSELGIEHVNMTNSPATRSYYYTYDGSESSYYGTDDQIQRQQVSHPSRRKFKDVDPNGIRNRFRANNIESSDQEMNYHRPSILQERQHHSLKGCQWNHHDEFVEAKRVPFPSREFISDHHRHHHKSLPPHPGFHSHNKHSSYTMPDKMDLLRTVCELKEQLDKIQFPKVAPRVANERPSPLYFDGFSPEMKIYSDPNLNPGRAEQSNHHRPAFSVEVATHYRHHQVNCSCLHCYPQERYHSAQLYRPSNPQQYSNSELSLWDWETKSDSQRHRDDEIKRLYLKEKYHTAKRHLRPLAGAAPVLTCYHCLQLLHLPEDLLLFEKRYNQVRCNACLNVLKFSVSKRTHIVPYHSDTGPAPPPSEAKPDYGRSFDRNYSATEAEQQKDRMMKSSLKESESKNKSLMRSVVESVGTSWKGPKMKKTSSEIEERQSTLHRLMGYASPSQVFDK